MLAFLGGSRPPDPPGGPANYLSWGDFAPQTPPGVPAAFPGGLPPPQTPRGSRGEPGREWEQQRAPPSAAPPGGSGWREFPREGNWQPPRGAWGAGAPQEGQPPKSMLRPAPVARFYRQKLTWSQARGPQSEGLKANEGPPIKPGHQHGAVTKIGGLAFLGGSRPPDHPGSLPIDFSGGRSPLRPRDGRTGDGNNNARGAKRRGGAPRPGGPRGGSGGREPPRKASRPNVYYARCWCTCLNDSYQRN